MSLGMTRFLALFVFIVLGFSWRSAAPFVETAAETAAEPSPLAEPPVLVELFASHNCPACPKAYRTLNEIKEDGANLLVLTWTVDYWDYLGTPDPMALPEAKARQHAYADHLSLRAPYTPQSVYDGVKECPATKSARVKASIKEAQALRETSRPRLLQTPAGLQVTQPCPAPLDVILIEYLASDAHDSDRVNPVIASTPLGTCQPGEEMFELDVQLSELCEETCAVLLQEPGYGQVMDTLVLAQTTD